jgi:hypothetical protein
MHSLRCGEGAAVDTDRASVDADRDDGTTA